MIFSKIMSRSIFLRTHEVHAMLICLDVHYNKQQAVAVGGLFHSWNDTQFFRTYRCHCDDVKPYEPGAFYQRELPCLTALLEKVTEPLTTIVIDGYVTLGTEAKKGLGAHLYEYLGCRIPVVGVAKTRFRDTPEISFLYRGKSSSPLYITTAGISVEKAKENIFNMYGEYRQPALLKEIDRLSRIL